MLNPKNDVESFVGYRLTVLRAKFCFLNDVCRMCSGYVVVCAPILLKLGEYSHSSRYFNITKYLWVAAVR